MNNRESAFIVCQDLREKIKNFLIELDKTQSSYVRKVKLADKFVQRYYESMFLQKTMGFPCKSRDQLYDIDDSQYRDEVWNVVERIIMHELYIEYFRIYIRGNLTLYKVYKNINQFGKMNKDEFIKYQKYIVKQIKWLRRCKKKGENFSLDMHNLRQGYVRGISKNRWRDFEDLLKVSEIYYWKMFDLTKKYLEKYND
jgi:hypothetical protein